MSPEHPSFSFYVDQPAVYLSPSDSQWSYPLPLLRSTHTATNGAIGQSSRVTYGMYFQSAADFLKRHKETLTAILHKSSTTASALDPIDQIDIHLVKHGAFYHPAKITLGGGNAKAQIVLNVAVGDAGRELLSTEAANLKRLGTISSEPCLPEVYAVGEGSVAGSLPLPMFAAQWFDGFSEFHAGVDPLCPECRIWRVWDDTGEWTLSANQLNQVFRQAAAILTTFYHPLTFETILDWHLAAGDFIVRRKGSGLEVRLITVRRYAPLFALDENHPSDMAQILDGLMLFLLDMSMRLRLDRLDGVGEVVWAEASTLEAIWEGFILGLRHMARVRDIPHEFVGGVLDYAAAHSEGNLLDLGWQVHGRLQKLPEESTLIGNHLHAHVAALTALMQSHHQPSY